MLEVNALYSAARLAQPLEQPILLCSSQLEGSGLEGYDLAGTLVALEFHDAPFTSSIWVEQVAWTQAPQLARVWCDLNDASDWLALVARELAHGLESHADLLAYLAYLGDDAVGMMVASSDGIGGLWAGADDAARALFARGANDLGRLEITVPLERSFIWHTHSETARFHVFSAGNRIHQSFEA